MPFSFDYAPDRSKESAYRKDYYTKMGCLPDEIITLVTRRLRRRSPFKTN
ncbi:hypothetical protein GO755_33340 [Spirosoma sp. HMF4905]|uniref:Uncharacterized protein n=1 Tax=Spirosoma arboris TaxID=2682092 RepID=A0A7K1SMC9_9BACT|nr:hypothetical protein [Spirosoma arboris]MVM34960.1 hypothetical protein [Spirosoma arboris]